MKRVVWQCSPDAVNHAAWTSPASLVPDAATVLSRLGVRGAVTPVFRKPPHTLRSILSAMPAFRPLKAEHDLSTWFHAFVEDDAAAKELEAHLLSSGAAMAVQVQPRPTPAFMLDEKRRRRAFEPKFLQPDAGSAPTDDLTEKQGYLGPAPNGIDALHAWEILGGTGGGIRVIDVEFGWNFDHEDLRANQAGVVYGSNADDDHGTAVLGIFSADKNGLGVTGIAHAALSMAASATFDSLGGKWNAADAICAAADRLRPGDVILLEMHAPGPHSDGNDQNGYVPVEYWQPEFLAIQYATARGVYVVEAAGNGGESLDHPNYDGRFDLGQRDSGAIMVGGGASPLQLHPRSRIWWSNFGSRVDVQGWGEDIVTCGGRGQENYHDLISDEDPSRCYTQSFGGTSGASPIIVGAVAVISAARRAAGRRPLTPVEMRKILREYVTPQSDAPGYPATQHIGGLPDLRRCVEAASQLG